MIEEDLEIALKVIVIGNGGVGKSSMIQRYCKGIFTRDYKKTIGVDFLEREICIDCEDVRLMLWDTAGQEEFDAITKSYYRGSQACVLVFSTTDRASFDAIPKWQSKVIAEVGLIPTVLVQNKIDLIDQAAITDEESEELAIKMNVSFYRVSVKENYGVESVFHYVAQRYLHVLRNIEESDNITESKHIPDSLTADSLLSSSADEFDGDYLFPDNSESTKRESSPTGLIRQPYNYKQNDQHHMLKNGSEEINFETVSPVVENINNSYQPSSYNNQYSFYNNLPSHRIENKETIILKSSSQAVKKRKRMKFFSKTRCKIF